MRKWRHAIKRRKFRQKKRRRRVNIAKLTKISFLPSLFTIFSLFMGYLALLQIIKGNFINSVYLIGASVILDGFDGTVARLTKTESNFGMQLDSLVDAVAFGLVTSAMIYFWGFNEVDPALGKVTGFVFLSAGVIRLARFNVLKEADAMPSEIFVGLPIPLGALSIVSAVLLVGGEEPVKTQSEMLPFAMYVLLIAFLMISSIKYRTLKKIKSKNTVFILLFLAVIIALSLNFPRVTIPSITFLYLSSPILFYIFGKFRTGKDPAVESPPETPHESEPQPDREPGEHDK